MISGEIDMVPQGGSAKILVNVYDTSQFTGEVDTLSGRWNLLRKRVAKSVEVIELDRQHMLALVQADTEFGDILMRVFVLRRLVLVAAGIGDVVLIGSKLYQYASNQRIPGA